MKTLDISNKVVYQIYPKSFKDSNGDGWGDLRGVTQKLDYLAELGVDYIWLTPFFPSPQRDNGYDVADYRAVDPRYGTMADFEELACEARSRGIGITLDMVLNHTSTDHEWYRRALAGEKRYQDYYFFRDGDPDKLPSTGPRSSAAPPGCGSPRWASGACTCLTRHRPTSTGATPRYATRSRTSCASGKRRA